MNSVCRFIEDNVFCVKFCVHAVESDSVSLSRRRVRLRSVCIDWIGHTMSYSLHLRSVEDHLLLDNVWRYLLNLFLNHPSTRIDLQIIAVWYRITRSSLLKNTLFWSRSHRICVRRFSWREVYDDWDQRSRYQTSDTSVFSGRVEAYLQSRLLIRFRQFHLPR